MKKIASIVLMGALIVTVAAGCSRVVTGNEEADKALASFNAIVKANEDKKGFHMEMQHWGLALPGDDKFEWSKDRHISGVSLQLVLRL